MSIPHAIMIACAVALYTVVMDRRDLLAKLKREGFTGKIVYSDADGNAPLLVSAGHQLCGKPDWVIRTRWLGRLIPLEKKTRSYSGKVYPGEVMQLTAYALIIEDITGMSVKLGRLIYTNRTIDIKLTGERRDELAMILREIRDALSSQATQPRSHDVAGKCGSCGFARRCPESLARLDVDPHSTPGDEQILRYR
ncbi:MAG TPA: Dna2/Cas4 domain-containing protein [Steroidobacteraceae bacterium]|nr:Dna2/Cas4 domain-containing protein [Steroidobacteraceae bacterium]